MLNNLFLLAVGAFGWGLSLATYRLFARRANWPMGALHADLPAIPILLGFFALLAGTLYAAFMGPDNGGWLVVICGVLLAFFWTFFLRVGSQISLFLAPIAGFFLVLGWVGEPLLGFNPQPWASESPTETYKRKIVPRFDGIPGNEPPAQDLR